jgi:menaquinone-9 beta-reductase
MSTPRYDVLVAGGGPGGSIAALVLARGGARVALVDKASFPRDKACGDLVGPRGVALFEALGLAVPSQRQVGEMIVVGPSGRRVLLPARAGRTYPGHGVVVPRRRLDAWLRETAIESGAEPVTARVSSLGFEGGLPTVALDDGRVVRADVVIGADGANSVVAEGAGLVDSRSVLWGFAHRGYVEQEVDRPVIALWDEGPGQGFPGYAWVFPGVDGLANVGLGLGLRHGRAGASRAVTSFDAVVAHLRRLGLLERAVPGRNLGGWLKMGIVGTRPAHGRVLLVGDAAGLVNPLQGEGIAPAMSSGWAAAHAVLDGPSQAAERYRAWLARTHQRYVAVAAPVHVAAVSGSPRRVSRLGRALTAPGLGRALAGPWALSWNDLRDGAPPGWHAALAALAHAVVDVATTRSTTRRRLEADLR